MIKIIIYLIWIKCVLAFYLFSVRYICARIKDENWFYTIPTHNIVINMYLSVFSVLIILLYQCLIGVVAHNPYKLGVPELTEGKLSKLQY